MLTVGTESRSLDILLSVDEIGKRRVGWRARGRQGSGAKGYIGLTRDAAEARCSAMVTVRSRGAFRGCVASVGVEVVERTKPLPKRRPHQQGPVNYVAGPKQVSYVSHRGAGRGHEVGGSRAPAL
jgi:hypothetical protein